MLLSELTTMRVGGPARTIVSPTTRAELIATTLEVWASGEDWLVLGGGSNVIIGDEGFDGTVIHVGTRGIEPIADAAAIRLRVQAGEPWDAVVAHAVAEGWAGIEALSGIPGSAGAAPIQNIGAYGQELASSLVAVDFLDYLTGTLQRVPAEELGLGYRTSALKRGREGLVVAIELELAASDQGTADYAQLATALGLSLGDRAPLASVRSSVLALRAAKGMLIDPTDPDSASCGSFFTNPIVGENFARSLPADAPRWPAEPGFVDLVVPLGDELPVPRYTQDHRVKLGAAWLIEHSGIARGFALPGSRAAISSKHSLAITNRGGATTEQVAELARYVQARVLAEFGVLLQPEPTVVGVHL